MQSFLFLVLSSLTICLLLTPLCRDAFLRAGLVDHPDPFRKHHARPIPRVGGIGIVGAYVGAYALLLLSPLNAGSMLAQHLPLVWKLLPAAGLIFSIGLVDDLVGLRPWQKLLGEVIAAGWAYGAGVRILAIAGYSTQNWWSLPLTLGWLIVCTNAFNLIDGVDGLASGLGLFATLTTMIAALLQGNLPLALATAPLAGALLGFLRYNFNPASIFLGDSGSLLIGFLLGCYGVLWSQKSATLLAMTAPLMALAIPILDVCLSILRRYICRRPIFGADRGHIHHRLLDRGLTPRKVALLLYGFCFVGATFSLLQSVTEGEFAGIILVLFAATTWLGIQNLGYVEFGVFKSVILGGTVRRMLSAQLSLREFEGFVVSADEARDCWCALRTLSVKFGFHQLRARLAGEQFEEILGDGIARNRWVLRVPLPDGDYVNCIKDLGASTETVGLGSFAATISTALRAKLPTLRPRTEACTDLAALAGAVGGSGKVKVMSEAPAGTATYCFPASE
ncbi:MAG: MraY family glycosyltransferase [Bryobacteraceae bacterium]